MLLKSPEHLTQVHQALWSFCWPCDLSSGVKLSPVIMKYYSVPHGAGILEDRSQGSSQSWSKSFSTGHCLYILFTTLFNLQMKSFNELLDVICWGEDVFLWRDSVVQLWNRRLLSQLVFGLISCKDSWTQRQTVWTCYSFARRLISDTSRSCEENVLSVISYRFYLVLRRIWTLLETDQLND